MKSAASLVLLASLPLIDAGGCYDAGFTEESGCPDGFIGRSEDDGHPAPFDADGCCRIECEDIEGITCDAATQWLNGECSLPDHTAGKCVDACCRTTCGLNFEGTCPAKYAPRGMDDGHDCGVSCDDPEECCTATCGSNADSITCPDGHEIKTGEGCCPFDDCDGSESGGFPRTCCSDGEEKCTTEKCCEEIDHCSSLTQTAECNEGENCDQCENACDDSSTAECLACATACGCGPYLFCKQCGNTPQCLTDATGYGITDAPTTDAPTTAAPSAGDGGANVSGATKISTSSFLAGIAAAAAFGAL